MTLPCTAQDRPRLRPDDRLWGRLLYRLGDRLWNRLERRLWYRLLYRLQYPLGDRAYPLRRCR